MKRERRSGLFLALAGGIVVGSLVVGGVSMVDAAPQSPPSQPVVVTNTDDRRVPVETTGTVSIGNFPTTQTVAMAAPETGTTLVTLSSITTNPGSCSTAEVPLPIGVSVTVDRVIVSFTSGTPANGQRAGLRFTRMNAGGGTTIVDLGIDVSTSSGLGLSSGAADVGLVVRRNLQADATAGDIYHVQACANGGNASLPGVNMLLTWHK